MGEFWPEKQHEEFAPIRKDSTGLQESSQTPELDQELQQTAQKYKQAIETDRMSEAKIGNGLIKLLVQKLQTYDISSQSGRERQIQDIRKMDRFYSQMFGENLWTQIKYGALAEYGTALALSKHAGFSVFYPTTEEDVVGKIDWWVDLETDTGKNFLAIQVKTLHLSEDPEEKIFSISSEADIDRLTDRYGYAINNLAFFKKNAIAMLSYCQNWDNVRPVFIILPTVGSEYSRIHSLSGQPTNKEGQTVNKGKLDQTLGKEFYEEIVKKFLSEEVR